MKKIIFSLIISAFIIPSISFAHPGRTDSSGCHTCRTNCPSWGLSTGEYHCHRSKGVAQPIEPIKSIKSEDGVGKTVPAPEYKIPVSNTQKQVEDKTINTTSTNSVKVEKQSWVKRFFSWLF
ncbi:MAG: YHYH domain-containing protein [Minisyncoccia bacterium]